MAEFKKSNNFRGGGGRGGGFRAGGDRPKFPRSGGFSKSGSRDGARSEMFSATCAQCGKSCEVPFRPTGERPVLCRDCFGGKGDRPERRDGRRDSSPRSFDRTRSSESFSSQKLQDPDPRIDELKSQIESIEKKLDSILEIMKGQDLAETIKKVTKKKSVK